MEEHGGNRALHGVKYDRMWKFVGREKIDESSLIWCEDLCISRVGLKRIILILKKIVIQFMFHCINLLTNKNYLDGSIILPYLICLIYLFNDIMWAMSITYQVLRIYFTFESYYSRVTK